MPRHAKLYFIVPALLLTLTLSACDEGPSGSSPSLMEKALEQRSAGQFDAAIASLKELLQEQPENVSARGLLGQVHLLKGDALSASKELERARSLGDETEQVRRLLVNAWLIQGETERILEEVPEDFQPSTDEEVDLLISRGRALLIDQEFEAATATIERSLESGAQPKAYVGLAAVSLSQSDYEAAKAHVNEGLKHFPSDFRLLTLHGELLQHDENYAEAEAAFLKSESTNPQDLQHRYRIQFGLVQARLGQDNLEGAKETLEALTKQLPDDLAVKLLRGFLALQEKNYELAYNLSNEVINASEGNTPAFFVKGAASFYQGRIEDAHRHLSAYVARVPGNRSARQLLAMTQMRLGQADKAYQLLSADANANDLDGQYLAVLGDAARLSGHQDVSMKALREAVLRLPEDAAIRARLGLARIAAGGDEEAAQGLSDLEAAASLESSGIETKARLAIEYMKQGDLESADAVSREIQLEFPEQAIGFNLEGVSLMRQKKIDEAIGAFRKAVAAEPQDLGSIVNLSGALNRHGDQARAAKVLEISLQHLPGNLALMLPLAALEQQMGRVDVAEQHLKLAVDKNPGEVKPTAQLARLYLQTDRPDHALSIAMPALNRFPRSESLQETAGRAQLALGQYTEAARTFRRLAERHPDNPEPLYLLSQALDARGEDAEAEDAKVKAMQIAGNAQAVQLLLAEVIGLIGKKQPEKALETAKKIQADYPESPAGHTAAALALTALGRAVDAEAAFTQALVLDPANPVAGRGLADILWRKGERSNAMKLLRTVLEEYPKSGATLQLLAQYEVSQGNNLEGESLLKRAVEAAPQAHIARNRLARLYLVNGKPDQAVPLARQLVRSEPDNPVFLETAALVHMAVREYGKASLLYHKLGEIRGDDPRPFLESGRALMAARRFEDAIGDLDASLQRNEKLHAARFLLARALIFAEQDVRAGQEIERLKQDLPSNPDVFELQGFFALQAKTDGAGAVASFQQAYELDPSTARAIKLAGVLLKADQRDQAAAFLESALDKSPSSLELRGQLAQIYYDAERLDDAKAQYEILIPKAPDVLAFRSNYAWALLKSDGDLAQAKIQAERALAIAPENSASKLTLAVVLSGLGDREAAVEIMRSVSGAEQSETDISLKLAEGLANVGRKGEARTLLEELEGRLETGSRDRVRVEQALAGLEN